MSVKELAEKYFPKLWDIDRLNALVNAGKLTEAEYEEIIVVLIWYFEIIG